MTQKENIIIPKNKAYFIQNEIEGRGVSVQRNTFSQENSKPPARERSDKKVKFVKERRDSFKIKKIRGEAQVSSKP